MTSPWQVQPAEEEPAWPTAPGNGLAQPPSRRAVVAAAALAVVVPVLLGGPAGLVWALVSPRVAVQTGPSGPQLLEPETKAFVAADGLFLLVTSIVGLICGLLAWRLARRYGIPVLLALVVGGLLASLVAWKTGRLLGLHDYRVVLRSGAAGGRVSMNVELRATGVLVGWAVAAVVGYGGCVAASLARHPESAPADVPDRWRP